MISSMLSSTPLLPPPVLSSVWSGSLCLWIEISAYSLVQAQVCAKPLSVLVTSPAGSLASVAGSDHLISNGPDFLLCNRTVFGESKPAPPSPSDGSAQTISTELPPAASIAVKNGEGVADVRASNLRMTGLFSACSAIHAASWRQPPA